MKSPLSTAIRFSIICLITTSLSACAEGRRFYSSDPFPSDKVSLFITQNYKTTIHSIEESGKPIKNFAGLDMGELLPGQYTLCVGYAYIGTIKSAHSQGCVKLKLNAQPGYIYYVFPEFPGPNSWKPGIIDILHEEDYRGIEGGEQIHKRVKKYFMGERRVITQSEAGRQFNVWE